MPSHVLLIQDGPPDARVTDILKAWVDLERTQRNMTAELLRNGGDQQGFVDAVNLGFPRALEVGNHVILLNKDVLLPENWTSRLLQPILLDSNIATVTPMSNDATIFSVPAIGRKVTLECGDVELLDKVAQIWSGPRDAARAPTGVGFCMAMNINFLQKIPAFDTIFRPGYGEEVDWCRRAGILGGVNVGLPSLFVGHVGGGTFGALQKRLLIRTHSRTISSRYPEFDQEVRSFIRNDPMAISRLAMAIVWAWARAIGLTKIFIAHRGKGGAHRWLENQLNNEIEQGHMPIILRVGKDPPYQITQCTKYGKTMASFQKLEDVYRILDPVKNRLIVYSCGVMHSARQRLPEVLLKLQRQPSDEIKLLVHDYYMISPSYTLLNSDNRYVGVPRPQLTQDSVHRYINADGSVVELGQWQEEWGQVMHAAKEVEVFSNSSREIILQAYPLAEGKIRVKPHQLLHSPIQLETPICSGLKGIGVLGDIGVVKGSQVLHALSRILNQEQIEFRVVVLGMLSHPKLLKAPSLVHGGYKWRDVAKLVEKYCIHNFLVPSVGPETFCYAAHEALGTGFPVWGFNLGAQSEALARASNGFLISISMANSTPDDIAWSLVRAMF
eukprot:CAMPEP_0183823730 /NCGR_PEP_ID=MMETSP0807_2-20130328/211_1 /TAXON_ID=88271 /ORGANISM="Picocystis salinarum, Strain CCMP1897" /LENGTH=611 /DNA_ID=CAMNT_0026068637 /DNA_START=4646 /DNA_END=6478 /DNA_ORIENTATION=+